MSKVMPTVRMVLEAYPKIAAVERMRMSRPCEKTVENVIGGMRRLCELSSVSQDEPVSALTRKRLTAFLDAAQDAGLRPVTVWSYFRALPAMFARWTRPYYDDRKWSVPVIELPVYRRRVPRYVRPDSAILCQVKKWYRSLEGRPDRREWVLATLMLEFAMRNGDAASLRWSDFHEKEDVILCYMPHKTALSSGRTVSWPVHPAIWGRLNDYRAAGAPRHVRKGWGKNAARDARLVVPCARDVFVRLNRDLRSRGLFIGSKGCYELRKICIDHVYQKFGAEVASSISGDDIHTVTRYYADPSAVSVTGVRIVDLL